MMPRALAVFCACALAGCLFPALPSSAAGDAEAQATLDRSVRFLQEAQNPDGGFGGSRGRVSDPDFSAWAAYALAAAGINPRDQAQPGGANVFSYLTGHTAELTETTDFDRVALVALAAGTSPFAFGAVDPIDAILSRRLPDGSFAQKPGLPVGWVNSTIWSIFPLSAIGTPAAVAAVEHAGEWLLAQQRPDGSWGATGAGSAADADMTGAALEAIRDADLPNADEAERKAFEFLKSMQGPDGGFREEASTVTNAATTAWVVQGMWAAGVDPRAWGVGAGGPDPLSFLASLQRPDGSIGWTATKDMNSLWMTAQVGPALAGRFYPLAAVPREAPTPRRRRAHRARAASHRHAAARNGHGGTGTVPGDGVIAGGGGRGAALFSAPQPQSAGSTPKGVRSLRPRPAAPSAASADGAGPVSSAGAAGRRGGRGTGAGAGTVEGLLVGTGADSGSGAAPGLFAADSGGRAGSTLVAMLVAAILAAAALGSRRERAGMRLS